ncbi:MAG: hypothetical protein AVDCRST_MAG12-2477, partial [uncultured Rubrobacteraceae bacterium]
ARGKVRRLLEGPAGLHAAGGPDRRRHRGRAGRHLPDNLPRPAGTLAGRGRRRPARRRHEARAHQRHAGADGLARGVHARRQAARRLLRRRLLPPQAEERLRESRCLARPRSRTTSRAEGAAGRHADRGGHLRRGLLRRRPRRGRPTEQLRARAHADHRVQLQWDGEDPAPRRERHGQGEFRRRQSVLRPGLPGPHREGQGWSDRLRV